MTFAEKLKSIRKQVGMSEVKKTKWIITGTTGRKTECIQTGCF